MHEFTVAVVSGGLELKMDTPDEERTECLEQTIKLYDADDEEGEASEVILTRNSGTLKIRPKPKA